MRSDGEVNGAVASREMRQIPMWINGEEVISATSFDVISPQDGEKRWTASSASVDDAINAAEAAQRAFTTWRKAKPADIQKIFLKAADIMEARREELKDILSNETGALPSWGDFTIDTTVDMIRDIAGRAANICGIIPPTAEHGQGALVFKEPMGVILGIAPWNSAYILASRAFTYAVAAGNTVVLKGSERCPRLYWSMGSVFKQAGLPDGVLNVLCTRPSDAAAVTNALIEHKAIRKINFTGSTAVGSLIAEKAGKELKPTLMELGGKASAIVCEDADLEIAARECAVGAMRNAGQNCMSTERILVHKSILEPFAAALKLAIDVEYDPAADKPVLADLAAVRRNKAIVADATVKGAKILHGGHLASSPASKADMFRLKPTVVADVTTNMEIFYTESFGPTVSLIPVASDAEAVSLANDTDYGLSGCVFTKSLSRGLRLAKEIESAAIHINSMSIHDEAMLPHGGTKKSGWGRFNSQFGLDEFLTTKTVTYME